MSHLAAAFADPVIASQSVFRATMNALARPGVPVLLNSAIKAPAPLCPAAAAVALALLDYETPVWLDPPLAKISGITEWLGFHTGATTTADPKQAAFAFISDPANAPPLDSFSLGTPEYPDRSTTIVLQVERLTGTQPLVLSGPGIRDALEFSASPLLPHFAEQLVSNRALFPRGIDLLIACGDTLAALPRSVRVTERSN